jgi:hypothetical protein
VCRERGPISLVRIVEELFQGNSGSGLENRNKRPWGFVVLTTQHLYPLNLALTSPTSGGRSLGTVRFRTKTMEFVFLCAFFCLFVVFTLYLAFGRLSKHVYKQRSELNYYLPPNHRVSLIIIYTSTKEVPNWQWKGKRRQGVY